jgi:predicted permease
LLFARSLFNLMTVNAGFAQDGVLEIDLNLTQLDLPVERRYAFRRELLDRVRAMPGAEAAASVSIVPLDDWWNENILLDNNRAAEKRQSNFNRVSADYFRTLNIPVLAGRDFGDGDTVSAPKVAIVNESFARKFLDGANPLGRTFRIDVGPGATDHIYQIVALVKDTKYINLRENFGPIVYLAASQEEKPASSDQILLRSNLPVTSLITEARQALVAANPGIAFHFKVLKTQIRELLIRERLMATLSGFFGAIAALLASLGLYGVLSYAVAQRRQEIGVRLALGADRGRIVKMIMREAALLLAIGLVVGIALALAAAKTAGALLYGLQPSDPATYLLAVTLLAAVAAAASYLPARRASRVDPMIALRCD